MSPCTMLIAIVLGILWVTHGQPQCQTPGDADRKASPTNAVYNVHDWCTVPEHLDDTCFSNAIADVVAHGTTGFAKHRYAELRVPPEVYSFTHTVVVPAGINIGIHGMVQTGVFGSTIMTGLRGPGMPGSVDDFLVLSDSVDFKNLSFVQTSDKKRQGIVLGTPTVAVFDTHVNWCWFAGQSIGIHAVNVSGLDLSHNTFDSGTTYGILSDATQGDVSATAILADDLRGYNNLSSVLIRGDGSSRFSDITLGGLFDRSNGTEATIALTRVFAARVEAIWVSNSHFDLELNDVSSALIGPFISRDNGYESIRVTSSHDVSITDGSILNAGRSTSKSLAAIDVFASIGTSVHNVSSTSAEHQTPALAYGLRIDEQSSGSIVYGNAFADQRVAPEEVLDPSTVLTTHGLQVTGSLRNGTGLQHRRFPLQCSTSAKALATCTSPELRWDVAFPDDQYTATCTLEATTGRPVIAFIVKKPESIAVTLMSLSGEAATGTADCIAMHD